MGVLRLDQLNQPGRRLDHPTAEFRVPAGRRPTVEDLDRLGPGLDLRVEIVRGHLTNRSISAESLRVGIGELLDLGIFLRSAAFDHVARHGPGRALES